MSAFVVDEGHIDYLISAARVLRGPYLSLPFDPWTQEDLLGQVLLRENVRSVCVRYGTSVDTEEATTYADMIDNYRFRSVSIAPLTPVETLSQIILACDGLEYQSCESHDWDKADAHLIVSRIRQAAIQRLPGMRTAQWSITRENVQGIAS